MASFQKLLMLLCWVAFVHVTSQTGDPCDPANHQMLDNDRRRKPSYQAGVSEDLICDRYTLPAGGDNWYKFGSEGAQITETAPAFDYCATYAPLYLNSSTPNPDISDGTVNVTVCQHDYRGLCASFFKMEARKCQIGNSIVYLYKLQRPVGCDAAYCVDFVNCMNGQVLDPFNHVCVDAPMSQVQQQITSTESSPQSASKATSTMKSRDTNDHTGQERTTTQSTPSPVEGGGNTGGVKGQTEQWVVIMLIVLGACILVLVTGITVYALLKYKSDHRVDLDNGVPGDTAERARNGVNTDAKPTGLYTRRESSCIGETVPNPLEVGYPASKYQV